MRAHPGQSERADRAWRAPGAGRTPSDLAGRQARVPGGRPAENRRRTAPGDGLRGRRWHDMASVERLTVTLPRDLIKDIDRREKNRSKFLAEAVRRELDRRRREELHRSLRSLHPDSTELAQQGLEE